MSAGPIALVTPHAPSSAPPVTRSRADRRLAAGLAGGDPAALEAVHARFGATVFGYLVSVLRDRPTAEDVFQQVMTEVWQRGPQYDPRRAALSTWILTIARSRAIDELRRRRPAPLDPAELPAQSADATADERVDAWLLAHLLGRLPSAEREVLELRFFAGLSQSEIAARTGIAMGTIKTRMVRGLERLRAFMDEEGLA